MRVLFILLLLFLVGFFHSGRAQSSRYFGCASFQSNAVAMPFSGKAGIIHQPFHPGFRLGAGYRLKEKNRHRFNQIVWLGYIRQRLIHHLIPVYTETEWQCRISGGLYSQAGLSAGYVHVFQTSSNPSWRLGSGGEYQPSGRAGKGRFTGGLSLGFGYGIALGKGTLTPSVSYQFWVLAPFVKSYVPVLPNALLQAGIRFQPGI
jgi:hypothetical protein